MTFDTAKAFESKKKRTYDDLKILARSAVSNGRQEDFSISDNFDTATYYGATRLKDRVNDLQKKINSGNSEIIDYLKSAKWSDDSDYKYYNDRVKSLSSETSDFVNALKKNQGLYNELYGESSINELVQSFDSAKSNFSELLSKIENKKNIFSKWKSEDEYKAFTNTQKYKDYSYDDIQKEIASKQKNDADEKEVNWLKNFAVSKDYATSDDYSKALDGANSRISELKTQKKEYELERRRAYKYNSKETKNKLAEYDKQIKQAKKDRDALESGKVLKGREELIQGEMSVQNNADFDDVSSNREFGNPNREELGKYDIRNNAETWTVDAQGNYYNALGEKIGKDINAYTSKYADNGISDKLGLYLSTSDSERKEAAAGRTYGDTWATAINEGTDNNWQELSENEKAVYYYYLNKGERDKAYKFLDDMGYQLGLRANEKQKAKLEEANALELIAANAASVPENVFGGIVAFADDALNTVRGKDVNPYNSAHQFVNSAENTRGVTAQKIADSIDNDVISALVSNGYQAVMSGADSLLGAATLGSGYTVAMGMGAASQKAKELYENGASRGQIALGSLASGAIEWITEKFSYDFIVDKLWNNPKSGRALIKAVLASASNEGIEEVNSDILNMVSDAIIQGGNSVSEREVRKLINNTGVSEEEARNTVAAQNAINTFWSFYGGFISGGLMSGGGLALNLGQNALMDAAYETEYKKQSGKNIVDGDNVNALVEVARGLDDTKANVKLKALAEQIAATDTEKLSARQQAAFSNKVGKLYSEVQKAQATAHSESTGNAVRTVIEEKVKEKGVTDESDIKTATDAIFKTVYDEGKLSSSEDRLLKKYDLNGIATELLNDEENVMSHAIKAENETRGAYFETAKLADTDNSSARNVDTSDYDISDDGKTYRSDTGKEVKITGISTIKNGKMTVNLSDGSSTSLNNISLGSGGDAILYEGVLQMGVSAGSAQMIVNSYSPALGMTPLNYIRGVQDAVKYGKIGSKSFLNSGIFSGALPEQIRNSMYRVGEIEAERTAQKKAKAKEKYARKNANVKNNNGNVSFRGIDRNSLNERQKVSVNAVEAVFGEIGINVVFFQSETNENGVHIGKNGSYDPETNTIELDISAGVQGKDTVLFTAAHELTHFIAEWSPNKFKVFANFLVKNYERKGINVNQIVEERMQTAEANGREIDYDTAFEEVIADSCESFLRDSHLADRLVELAKADMTLFEKIKSYIKGLLEKVRKAYAGLLPDSKEGRFVLEMKESLEQLHDMWEKAALDARGNFKAAVNKTSDNSSVKLQAREQVKNIDNKTPTKNPDIRYSDRNYSYDALVSKPDMKVTVINDKISYHSTPTIRKNVIDRAIKNAVPFGKTNENGNVVINVNDIDTDVILSKNGLRHGLDRRFDVLVPVTLKAGEILKNAIKINELTPKNEKISKTYVLIGTAKNSKNEPYIVSFIVNRATNEVTSVDVLYAINAKTESAGSLSPSVPANIADHFTDSAISISELLNYVNKYFPDILPESVLKHYGHTERPDGKLGKSALFSDRNPEAMAAYAEINKQLEKENVKYREDVERLRELVRLQNKLTHGMVFTDSSMDVAARTLMSYANAKGEKSEFKGLLNEFYGYIAKGENLSWESVKEKAKPVINWLRDHEYHKAQRSEFADSVLKDLRTKRIALNDNQKQEAADLYGSYEEFRKRNMGRIIITDSGVSLDTQWAELAKAYPTLFDESITSAEQPVELMRIIEGLQNNDVNEYFFSNEMAEQDLFSKVYDTYWNVSTLHTVKDRMQTEINKLKAKHNEKIREMRNNHTEKDNELKQRYAERTAELRKYYKEREAQIAKDASERYQRSREGIAKTQIRGSIKKVITDLNGLLNQSTKKRNVKEGLKDTVSAALYSAEILFSPAITNEDIIRNGVKSATAKEMRLIAEYTDLLNKRDDYSDRIRKLGDMTASKQRNDTIAGLQNMIDYVNRKIAPINKELHSLFERERNWLYKAPVSVAIDALANAYSALKNSETAYIRNVYDDFVYNRIVALKDSLDGALIKDMNMVQLTELRDAYKMVLHTVREANRLFGEEKKATVTETADKVSAEIRRVGGSKEKQLVLTSFLKKQGWKFLKPVYAFRTIGSDTLAELYNDIRYGEDRFKRMIDKAVEAYKSASQKYNSSKWDTEKTYTFQSRNGKEFSLSLQQVMEIYGYSKRNQAMKHLVQGGIVLDNSVIVKEKTRFGVPLKYEVNAADAYGLNEEIIGKIADTLTHEQKSYVDELQSYLTELGEEGNKVSMALYGIKLFKEQNYLPIKSAEWYSNFRPDSTNEFSMRNSAFTKETNQFANNPIVLSNFNDVFGQHVNDMAMYCSFVLPLENFMKVFNYHTAATADSDARSVRGALKNAYGDGAEAYIRQLLRDLNGGVRAQSGAEIVNKLTGLAKKGAVFASASVTVQQISAIPRAMAYINAKYFATTANKSFNLKRHKSDWEEMKKWAPIAGIKEMGYFDTGLGKSTVNYITAEEYEGLNEKFGAFFKDSDFRDEILSKGPAFIDEIGWVSIWNAVKRETAEKTNLEVGSAEFFEKCSKRATEVITLTQVYDSVFSRSELMRSKDTGLKMTTAFMAEPTTVLNMVFDAALQAKRTGNFKFLGKALGAVLTSIVLNELLKALVTAGRDDDDDKTWLEKYISKVRGGVLDSINPLNYMPYTRDIMSLLSGYDVDRMDMAMFADLAKAIRRLQNSEEHQPEDWINLVTAMSAFAGIPAKNIYRDIKTAVNTFNDMFLSDNTTSVYGIEQALTGNSGYKNKAEIAFRHDDAAGVSNIVSQVEGKKVRDGKTEKQAKASVRSSFTATYKKKYLKAYKKGNIKEQNRIRSFLYATGLYGSLSELDAIIAKWIENSED